VQVAARAFDSALQSLQETCSRSIALDEAVPKMKDADEIPRIASEVSKIAADIDSAWRMFPLGAAALSFVLLDEGRLTDGRLQHPRLTSTERRALVAEIKRQYPRIQRSGDKHAIEATAWLLLTFLQREFKSADQK
jgi:hypothetical protein